MTTSLGICQWFHYQDYAAVDRCVGLMRELDVRLVRTGISWADFHRPGGQSWYHWQMQRLREFDLLVSIWHTPPSLAEGGVCAGPPRRLQDYADFVWQVIDMYGDRFSHLELWNEPNNCYKWDFRSFDPRWSKFAAMIRMAARTARRCGKPTVLGGMIPVDHHWLNGMKSLGALDDVDVIAIHAFPEMWSNDTRCWEWYDNWHGWDQKVAYIAAHTDGRPVWVTETGLATWDLTRGEEGRADLQAQMLLQAAAAPAERVYWYSLMDLDPEREAIEGFHEDENEYHLGLVKHNGQRKKAFAVMKQHLELSARIMSKATRRK